MDGFDLTERLITAAEFAEQLRVDEDDVLEWMLDGYIRFVDGADGAPRVRIAEQHVVDGPISTGFTTYLMSDDPTFRAELVRRRRERELAALDWGNVDLAALADALARRLDGLVPDSVEVSAQPTAVILRGAHGGGVAADVAFGASFPDSGSGAERVRHAAVRVLEVVQDELIGMTTDPWPLHGHGELPAPHAKITAEGDTVRLFYGELSDPVLELEPLRIAEVLSDAGQ